MPANRPFWGLLSRRSDPEHKATELYGRLVAQSRLPAFYADLGVGDTPEGRLELIMLHMVLVLRRLARGATAAEPVARALTERFVVDVDDCLREMGVSDLGVARKVKKIAAALFDRVRDYGRALDAADEAALAAALGQSLAATGGAGDASLNRRIAAYALTCESALAGAGSEDVVGGGFVFPAPAGQ